VGAERSRLVVDEDGPIRVARGHVAIVRLCTGAGSGLRWGGYGSPSADDICFKHGVGDCPHR
jgi:hypothetical protein